jgi:hypothetical protein
MLRLNLYPVLTLRISELFSDFSTLSTKSNNNVRPTRPSTIACTRKVVGGRGLTGWFARFVQSDMHFTPNSNGRSTGRRLHNLQGELSHWS